MWRSLLKTGVESNKLKRKESHKVVLGKASVVVL